jgi:hypothetical protein
MFDTLFSSFEQELLLVYLKPSFSVDGLKGLLHKPGTTVLLKDVLCQKMEGAYMYMHIVFRNLY